MSDGAATPLQCANCAAPLSPPASGQIDLVCHYCGGTTRIADAHDDHPKHGHAGPSEDELARRRAQSERDRAKNAEENAGHLGLSAGSLIKGGIAGVDARGVMLSIDTSRIAGGTTGLHAKALLQIVSAKSSTIAGGTSAIVYEYPSKPSLDGITLEGAYSNH